MVLRKALLAAALVLALVPPAPGGAYEPHVLRYSDTLDITTLNPWFGSSGNIQTLSEVTAAFLTRLDAKGNAVPELATVVPSRANGGISADGRTITWHLRRGVRWSDGAPFDASDVTYSVAVAKNPANNITIRDPWDRLVSATASDPYTVTFHLKAPYATFVTDYFNTQSSNAILPKHLLGPATEINQAPYNALPIGIGPFRYTAFRRGDAVEMEANPYYWRGRPRLRRIIYKLIPDPTTALTQLQTGEIDLMDTVNGTLAPQAKALPGKAWSTRLSPYMSGIYLNVSRPQLREAAVRRALRLATNRPLLFDKVVLRNGILTESIAPPFTHGYLALPLVRYDPAAAMRMLDADGWKLGPDGVRHKDGRTLTLDLALPAGYAPSATLAAIVHNDWAKIGVATTIHNYAPAQFFAPYSEGGIIQVGRFDGALLSQSAGPVFANVNGGYTCDSIPPRGFNLSHYCNPAVDALNDRYVHSYDPAVQDRAAAQFQRIIDEDAPVIMVYERTFLAVFDKRLHGYHPNSFTNWGDPMQIDI